MTTLLAMLQKHRVLDVTQTGMADKPTTIKATPKTSKTSKKTAVKSAKSTTKKLTGSTTGVLTGGLKKVIDTLKGIGKPEPVTITWYTGHDLLNPSCWDNTPWHPSVCAPHRDVLFFLFLMQV